MTNSEEGLLCYGIYLAKVYFADKPHVYKVRPILVLELHEHSITALKLTSNLTQSLLPAYELDSWRELGLTVPSAVLLRPRFELPRNDVFQERFLGLLSQQQAEIIRKAHG